MKTYIKPSVEVIETELKQMLLGLSTSTTGASSELPCLDKEDKGWTDSSSFWGE